MTDLNLLKTKIQELSLEELSEVARMVSDQQTITRQLEEPSFHIRNDRNNVIITKKDTIDDNLIPRSSIIIGVNKEAILEHKILWGSHFIMKGRDPEFYTNTQINDYIIQRLNVFLYNNYV